VSSGEVEGRLRHGDDEEVAVDDGLLNGFFDFLVLDFMFGEGVRDTLLRDSMLDKLVGADTTSGTSSLSR